MKKTTHKIPFIAIIGKPNVGKSSLFNRIVGRKVAIISDISGTTRDRVFRKVQINNIQSILVDTGGLEFEKKENIEADMQTQAHIAIDQADLVIFMVDGRFQPTIDDFEIAKILRKKSKKIILVANKIDRNKKADDLANWHQLGFDYPIDISVTHNINLDKLENILSKNLINLGYKEENQEEEQKTKDIKLAIIGRPNAGKSSLINALTGENRLIVSDISGTTRDAIDIELEKNNQLFTLIDTAGLRRKGKIEKGIEKYSSFRTIDAIERSDIVCLMLDYSVGIRAQDLHISSYILDAHKGLIILINKYDLMENKEEERTRINRILKHRFDYLSWAPVLYISAKNHKNLELILETAVQIKNERNKELDQEVLRDWLTETIHKHHPPSAGRNRLHFYTLIQIPSATPTFEFLVSNKDSVHFSYQRYLENSFRENFGFIGTSIRFFYKNLDKKLIKKSQPL